MTAHRIARRLTAVAGGLALTFGGLLVPIAAQARAEDPTVTGITTLVLPLAGFDLLFDIDTSLNAQTTCTLTQRGTIEMNPDATATPAALTEAGRNVATTNCDKTLITRVTSQVIVRDDGVSSYHKTGVVAVGAGQGPVIGTVSQNVPLSRVPGPTVTYQFISTARSNIGRTGRVCQQATVTLFGSIADYRAC